MVFDYSGPDYIVDIGDSLENRYTILIKYEDDRYQQDLGDVCLLI